MNLETQQLAEVLSELLAASATTIAATRPVAWWDGVTAGWIGVAVGVLGGLMGSFVGIGSNFKSVRPVIPAVLIGTAAIGAVMALLGLVALLSGQPYEVWYLLLPTGAVLAFVSLFVLPAVRARVAQDELNRIRSQDSGGPATADPK